MGGRTQPRPRGFWDLQKIRNSFLGWIGERVGISNDNRPTARKMRFPDRYQANFGMQHDFGQNALRWRSGSGVMRPTLPL